MRSLAMNSIERAILLGGVCLLALGFGQAPAVSDEDPVVVALRAELARSSEVWAAREAQLVTEMESLHAGLERASEVWAAREGMLMIEVQSLRTQLAQVNESGHQREAQSVAVMESLRAELQQAEEARMEREREWLVWTHAMSQLAPEGIVEVPNFEVELSPEELEWLKPEAEPVEGTRDVERLARSEEIERSLRTLLRLEWVDGFTLLEAGLLSDEGWTGPCVFRLVGADGRAVGSVSAERLSLEGSVAGRTLTLILEEGYERRTGDLLPFEGSGEGVRRGGERRIVLVRTDPRPWMEAMPELFREREAAPSLRTTRHNHEELRRGMNRLLAEDSAGGRWRLEAFEGVGETGLIEVDLVDLDEGGRARRHLFADNLRIERRESGVVLVLTDGVQMQGNRKTPFLAGRFRIFLPQARHVGWEEVGLLPELSWKPALEGTGAGTQDSDGR